MAKPIDQSLLQQLAGRFFLSPFAQGNQRHIPYQLRGRIAIAIAEPDDINIRLGNIDRHRFKAENTASMLVRAYAADIF